MSNQSPDPWVCAECGKEHPVPSLARACERLHQRERALTASARPRGTADAGSGARRRSVA
ncbi:hypothetical protein [Cellulomonas sp.]|uniref:hypothetical protein n=1 Tax=Cellulomonas sp. TaxID=40001 RepID=UPI001B197557|nr:hypothetical protein [Cellulomonas sp.]MBO9553937.1 hypothetical protein [Cellulomonas sp.]